MSEKQTRKRSRGNGEGSIYYSESKKKWIAQYTTGRTAEGKQSRKTFYADTRKAVKTKLENYIKGNVPENSKNLTIHDIVTENYGYKLKANLISENTYARAINTVKRIDNHYIGKISVKNITENDIQNFFCSITHYSNSVIKKIYSQLRFAFDYCVNNDILLKNPLNDKIRLPMPKSDKPTRKISALTVDEQKQLIEVLVDHPDQSRASTRISRSGFFFAYCLNLIKQKEKHLLGIARL